MPAQQLYSQSGDVTPPEQSLPAEWINGSGTQMSSSAAAIVQTSAEMRARSFVPMIMKPGSIATQEPDRNDPQSYINSFRSIAGVPAVTFNEALSAKCWYHARYMAEENEITHNERTNSSWFSIDGQSCGQNSNAWLGSAFTQPYWQPYHAINGWISSVGHRMWMLYPTTPAFGFAFYTASNNRAGAAMDVLSLIDTSKDLAYAGWPVKYPAPNQTGVPAQAYSITLGWRYFGSSPTVSSVSLTANGNPIAFTHTTVLPVGHKGIEIKPSQPLPANSTITVSVAGSYDNKPFNYTWSFKTGS